VNTPHDYTLEEYNPPQDRAQKAFQALFAGQTSYDKSVLDLVAIQGVLFDLAHIASGVKRTHYWRAIVLGAQAALDHDPVPRWPGQKLEEQNNG
jgi:hypothetical protein